MTPLAMKVANQLTTPLARRAFSDGGDVAGLISRGVHCFDITAIAKHITDVTNASDMWTEIETLAHKFFLPSPITWLEYKIADCKIAWVIEDNGEGLFGIYGVYDNPDLFSLHYGSVRLRGLIEAGDRISITLNRDIIGAGADWEANKKTSSAAIRLVNPQSKTPIDILQEKKTQLTAELNLAKIEAEHNSNLLSRLSSAGWDDEKDILSVVKDAIAFCFLAIDLINTPGLIGLRQNAPHKGLAKKMLSAGVGKYPLRGWSEVVLKHQTMIAGTEEKLSGVTNHKCLHFVRSHLRHLQCGKTIIIPAHWRGDAALGIKRTRYRLAA